MRYAISIVAGLVALASTHPTTEKRENAFGCATEPTEEFKAIAEAMAAKEAIESADGVVSAQATIEIQTYFHVVASST